jgi:protoheme IX farnesyltransferase
VSLLPTAIGLAGMPYLVGASLLGARFVLLGWRLGRDSTLAMATFRFSIVYLAAIFALLLADHLMSAWIGPT